MKTRKCYNCKFAGDAFKAGGGVTHHVCLHPKHNKGLKDGSLSPWDTVREFYNTCESHKPKKVKK